MRPEEVPEHIAAMDLGAIPFDVENPTAYYAAPNKMWEYLSQGVDIVSTPIPEVMAHRDLVNIVRSKEDYIAVLKRKAKKREWGDHNRSVVEYVKRRTWSSSAERTKWVIRKVLREKRTWRR